ncbi:MAG: hypothetical protein PGN21_03730 [Sphingomonas paucimobilis]
MIAKMFAAGLMLTATAAAAPGYQPTGPIERKYSADGPWATSVTVSAGACDREGNVCDIWYPTDLGSNPLRDERTGFRHPVIVFANGTADTVPADKNATFLRHLASWGFVVVRSRDGWTGGGETVVDAAEYILEQGEKAGTPFFRRLDPGRVGLTGHSQGAGTAVKLFAEQNRLFATYVPISTPERPICIIAGCAPPLASLPTVGRGSIFYVSGNVDVVSPLPVNLGYYLPTANGVDKALGMITLGSHTEIEGSPGCAAGGLPASCNIGVYPLLGYPTAWFMWKLQDAADGAAAFRSDGELAHAAPNWLGYVCNIR